MRKAIVALLLLATSAAAQPAQKASPPTAASLVAAATARARAEHKLVMVEFTASWCGWCHKYERFLNDTVAGVGKIMRDNFVVVAIVVQEDGEKAPLNNPGGDTMFASYAGSSSVGIPFYAMLDVDGNVLGTANAMPDGSNIGHPAVEEEYEAYDRLLAKVAPRITPAERLKIKNYLRAMK